VSEGHRVIEAEVVGTVDRLSQPSSAAPLAVVGGATAVLAGAGDVSPQQMMQFLRDMGFPVPIASPEQLRTAFDYQTRMFAAVLAESDYLYVVSYKSNEKQQANIFTSLDEAKALAERFAHLGAAISAKPKKSGVVKLARALGITARVERRAGLPEDPLSTYSFVEYMATHEGSGRSETGVGWCDLGERNGRITKHDCIATADTRAYNRAVLRLAGFGDVSAEEIVPTSTAGDEPPASVPEQPKYRRAEAPPGENTDIVLAACSAWAEAAASRADSERYLPAAGQDTREARELRAKARRGDVEAATRLGARGLHWHGTAIDGNGFEPWNVTAPAITAEQVLLGRRAAAQVSGAVSASAQRADARATGWDLSSKGSGSDDAPATAPATAAAGSGGPPGDVDIPAPDPSKDAITSAQAKKVSMALKDACNGNVEQVRAWLREHCKVASTTELRTNQYDALMRHLSK
jgi:hypothetical protein